MLLFTRVLSTEAELPQTTGVTADADSLHALSPSRQRAKDTGTVRWGGIHSIGNGDSLADKNCPASANPKLVRQGFLSKREILTSAEVWVDVWCSIDASGDPQQVSYTCRAHGGHLFSADNPTTPCRMILQALNAKAPSCNWNGADFFGLTRHPPQLARSLEDDEENVEEAGCSSSSRRAVKKLTDLLHHGSVPTSELRQKRSAHQRNEAIHEIVTAASFGDVKSKHAVFKCHLVSSLQKLKSSPSSNMVFIHMLAL